MTSMFGCFCFALFLTVLNSGVAFSLDSNPCPKPNPAKNIFQSPIAGGAIIAVESTDDEHNPLSLAIYEPKKNNECAKHIFAKYSMEGGSPKIESLFFYKIKGFDNVLTIVSWEQNHRALGIYGKLYQVYAYTMEGAGLRENKEIANDDALSGMDGQSDGESSIFKYKTAAIVKSYLKNKYH